MWSDFPPFWNCHGDKSQSSIYKEEYLSPLGLPDILIIGKRQKETKRKDALTKFFLWSQMPAVTQTCCWCVFWDQRDHNQTDFKEDLQKLKQEPQSTIPSNSCMRNYTGEIIISIKFRMWTLPRKRNKLAYTHWWSGINTILWFLCKIKIQQQEEHTDTHTHEKKGSNMTNNNK